MRKWEFPVAQRTLEEARRTRAKHSQYGYQTVSLVSFCLSAENICSAQESRYCIYSRFKRVIVIIKYVFIIHPAIFV